MLSSLLRRFTQPVLFATPTPSEPICVIGDVHGCFHLLQMLLERIPQDHRIILVGDYVDRGERSADVLRLLADRPDLTCLMGNHEDMLLRFLDHPERCGPRWLRHGGLQTLASFGLPDLRPDMTKDELRACRDQALEALGPRLVTWLRTRPASLLTGNVLINHAGADPAIPVDQQPEQVLLWGHLDFVRKPRKDGLWVVHGHTITDRPTCSAGRIAIDTGAYATGRLSAVCLGGSDPSFLCANSDGLS